MATQSVARHPSTVRRFLRPIGVVLLIAGLIGLFIWQLKWFEADLHGTVSEDSFVSDVAYVIDWLPKPGLEEESDDPSDYLLIAKDEDDNIIWEGPQDEWGKLYGEAQSAVQTDLRNTWLIPSILIAGCGLLLVIFGRRRTMT